MIRCGNESTQLLESETDHFLKGETKRKTPKKYSNVKLIDFL